MKKFITLLLVLTGMVSTAMATDITIYFKPGNWWTSDTPTFKLNMHKTEWSSKDFGYDSTNDVYYVTVDMSGCTEFNILRYVGSSQYGYSATLTSIPTSDTYYVQADETYENWTPSSTTYIPWRYYLMSNKNSSWKAVGQMTEDTGVYSYKIAAATYADKELAIAKGDAFNSDGSFPNGTDYANWKNAIRPVAGSTHYQINFANYSGTTETNRNDGSAALWYIASDNDCGDITLNFTPGATPDPTFSVTCEHSVAITTAGYATYSFTSAYPYKVDGATAYKITVDGDIATLNSLGESANIPAGTGIIISGDAKTYTVTPKEGDLADVSGNLLIGSNNFTYNITGKSGDDDYDGFIFADGANGVGFYKLDPEKEGGNTLAAHKAFLAVPKGTLGDARDFIGLENDVTGIQEINNNANVFNGAIYNLQGVRLSKFQKGLNIVNGKKVLVK